MIIKLATFMGVFGEIEKWQPVDAAMAAQVRKRKSV